MNDGLKWTEHGAQVTCRFTLSSAGHPPRRVNSECGGPRLTLPLRVTRSPMHIRQATLTQEDQAESETKGAVASQL